MKIINKVLIGVGIAALVAIIGLYISVTLFFLLNMEPLHFSINNGDVNKHEVTVEIFDSDGKSIFNEIYEVSPKKRIYSPEITKKKGDYMFKVTLDNEIEKTYKAKVGLGRGEVTIWLYVKVSGKIIPIDITQIV